MEHWCNRHNRMIALDEVLAGVEQDLSLVTCTGHGCEYWLPGPVVYCIHMVSGQGTETVTFAIDADKR